MGRAAAGSPAAAAAAVGRKDRAVSAEGPVRVESEAVVVVAARVPAAGRRRRSGAVEHVEGVVRRVASAAETDRPPRRGSGPAGESADRGHPAARCLAVESEGAAVDTEQTEPVAASPGKVGQWIFLWLGVDRVFLKLSNVSINSNTYIFLFSSHVCGCILVVYFLIS